MQLVEGEAEVGPGKVDSSVSNLLLSSNIWRSDVLHYIAGYIVRKVMLSIDCSDCAEALYSSGDSCNHGYQSHLSLLSCKRYGNLIVPSQSVFKVVSCVDKLARKELCKWASFPNSVTSAITSSVLAETRNSTFSSMQAHSMENHILDSHLRDDHITVLIKLIVSNYLTLFFHQFGKVYTERIIKRNNPSRRNKVTKTILFYNE